MRVTHHSPQLRGKMSFWAFACLLMGLAMIAGGIVLVFTIYMAVIGLFFIAMGVLLCVGALESTVHEMEAHLEPEDGADEPPKPHLE